MKTITEYRSNMLTILGDATGRRYTSDMLDMGLREALINYQSYCPNKSIVNVNISNVIGGIIVFPWLFGPGNDISLIKRQNTGEILHGNPYFENGKIFLSGDQPIMSVGETLEVTISGKHLIKGLDDADFTTVPDAHSLILVTGAAGFAMRIRARSVTEVFGKRPEDREALSSQANRLINDFIKELGRIQPASADPLPRGEFPI